MKSLTLMVPNAILFVMDDTVGQVPLLIRGQLVSANETCVAIGCRSEHEGPTIIDLGLDLHSNCSMVFEGSITTPSRTVSLYSALNEELMALTVQGTSTSIRIFANNPVEPDHLVISLFENG